MALSPPLVTEDVTRMTGIEILRQYGPDIYRLVGDMQGSGMIPFRRTAYDEAVTTEVRLEIIAKEGDCRCGKIDCWKREMGIE